MDNNYDDRDRIEDVATIKPQRIKAKWVRKTYNRGYNSEWECNVCGYTVWAEFVNYNYCPNCGIKMGD